MILINVKALSNNIIFVRKTSLEKNKMYERNKSQ